MVLLKREVFNLDNSPEIQETTKPVKVLLFSHYLMIGFFRSKIFSEFELIHKNKHIQMFWWE